jgi:DnaJ-domain-containing protein 1
MSGTAATTHYQTLGVPQDATAEQIKKAFRALARQYHPDTLGNDNPDSPEMKEAGERFKRITHAHDILSDPAKRRSYDFELQRPSFPAEGGIRVDFNGQPGFVRFNTQMPDSLSQEDLFRLMHESLMAQMYGAPAGWSGFGFFAQQHADLLRAQAAIRRFTARIVAVDRIATLLAILFGVWVIITWISGTGLFQLLLSTASRPETESPIPIFGILIGLGVGMLVSTLVYLYAKRRWRHTGYELITLRVRMLKAVKDLSSTLLVLGSAAGLLVGRFFF